MEKHSKTSKEQHKNLKIGKDQENLALKEPKLLISNDSNPQSKGGIKLEGRLV